MKPSNKYKDIFEINSSLTREDIEAYGDDITQEGMHFIEKKELSDSFDKDAMEGWESINYQTSHLKKLDKNFIKGNSLVWYWLIGISAVITVSLLLIANLPTSIQLEQGDTKQFSTVPYEESTQRIIMESSDIIIPENINQFNEIEPKSQIKSDVLKDDFASMIIAKENLPAITPLPIIQIDQEKQTLIDRRQIAKEIYFSELKLIDYSHYINTLEVNTEQLTLTGTPANMENEDSKPFDATYENISIPYDRYLKKSIQLFEKNQFKKSLTRFEKILETYPEDINAHFYTGMCLINFGKLDAAISSFEKCLSSNYSNFDEEANWMIATCYEMSGNVKKANSSYQEIVLAGGFYKKQAEAKLKE